MNLSEHALKELAKLPPKPPKQMSRPRALMTTNKDLMLDIIESGGSLSTIGRELNISHGAVSRYLGSILGEEAKKKAKANGVIASAGAVNGKKNPRDGLIYS